MLRLSKYQFEKLSYNVIGACIDVQKQLGLHLRVRRVVHTPNDGQAV